MKRALENSLSRQNQLVIGAKRNFTYFARQMKSARSGSLLAYASENHK